MTRTDTILNFTWTEESSLPIQGTFSARWLSTLTAPADANIQFSATFDNGVRLWVCDHLLLDSWQTSKLRTQSSGKVLPLTKGKKCLLRLEYLHVSGTLPAGVTLMWNGSTSAKPESDPTPAVVPSEILSPEISSAEQTRQAMRTEHANLGWGTWENSNMLSTVLLPEAISFSLGFQKLSANKSLSKLIVFRRDNPCRVYPGPHSYNFTSPGSVSQVTAFGWEGLDNITVTTMSGDHGEMYISAAAMTSNLSDFAVVVSPEMLWTRQGSITVDPEKGTVETQSVGLRSVHLQSVYGETSQAHLSSSQIAFSLKDGKLVLCAGFGSECPTGQEAAQQIMQVFDVQKMLTFMSISSFYGTQTLIGVVQLK